MQLCKDATYFQEKIQFSSQRIHDFVPQNQTLIILRKDVHLQRPDTQGKEQLNILGSY